MRLMGRDTGLGEGEDSIAIERPPAPLAGGDEADAFVRVAPDLVGVGGAVGMTHGRRTAGQVEDAECGTPHGS